MTLLAKLKVIAPEFDNDNSQEKVVDKSRNTFLQNHIDIADDLIATSIITAVRDSLVIYLAAHNIDLALKRKGASGQVSSVKEGALSITYATSSSPKSEYDNSSYGRKYQQLVKNHTVTLLTRSSF
jgi:hypothetical protein